MPACSAMRHSTTSPRVRRRSSPRSGRSARTPTAAVDRSDRHGRRGWRPCGRTARADPRQRRGRPGRHHARHDLRCRRPAVPHQPNLHAQPGRRDRHRHTDGVGYVRTPPWLLQPGDVVEVEVDRLGVVTPHRGRRGRAREWRTGSHRRRRAERPRRCDRARPQGNRGVRRRAAHDARPAASRGQDHQRADDGAPPPVGDRRPPCARRRRCRWRMPRTWCSAHLLGHEITRFPAAFGLTVERRDEYAESGQQAPQPVVEQVLRMPPQNCPP